MHCNNISATALPSHPHTIVAAMPTDEFTLRVSFLMGFFVVLSLFVSRYFRRDPMVRPLPFSH